MDKTHPDARLIDRLGGPANLARKLGFDARKGGVQRVNNWKRRGIPALVRLNHRAMFERASKDS